MQKTFEIKSKVREQAFLGSPEDVFERSSATETIEIDGYHVDLTFCLSIEDLLGRDVLCWRLHFKNALGGSLPDGIGYLLIKNLFGGWHSLMEINVPNGRCIVKPANDMSFGRKKMIMSHKNSTQG